MKTLSIRTTYISLCNILVKILSLILAGTLLYTATKKAMDLEAFSAHLELVPYVGNTEAYVLTILIILVEYVLGLIILYRPQDARGYLILLSLMLVYTGYIYYILHHAPFLPCSCQGAFKGLSWEMHYTVNALVGALAGLSYGLIRMVKKQKK